MVYSINLDSDVWIGRKDKCTFKGEAINVTSAESEGSMTLTIADASNLAAGDQIIGNNAERINISGVSGNTLKLKTSLQNSYSTSDTIGREWVETSSNSYIVKISTREREHSVQIKYGDHKNKISGGDWGEDKPQLEVRGQLEMKESFKFTGKLIADRMSADVAETALRDMALMPMAQFKYNFGDPWPGIIDKVSITQDQTITQKAEHSDLKTKTDSRDVKLKVTYATKK